MPVNLSSHEISEKYDQFARWYDLLEGVLNFFGLGALRQRLIRRTTGKVLEIAVGTGKNLRYYPGTRQIVAVDLSKEMLTIARKRASGLRANILFILADAEALPFANKSFETVVSSLSSCTFPSPVSALREMTRVCKSNGRILLLEHGRSNLEWLGRFQDNHADQIAKRLGCHWNREPYELARRAGFRILSAQRFFLGVFHVIEATL